MKKTTLNTRMCYIEVTYLHFVIVGYTTPTLLCKYPLWTTHLNGLGVSKASFS